VLTTSADEAAYDGHANAYVRSASLGGLVDVMCTSRDFWFGAVTLPTD
jgi:hypothetical protein